MTRIVTQRLVIRPFEPGDAEKTFAAITPRLTRLMSWEPAATPEDFEKRLARLAACDENGHRADFHNCGEVRPELGLWIKEAAQGRGFGKETMMAARLGVAGAISFWLQMARSRCRSAQPQSCREAGWSRG